MNTHPHPRDPDVKAFLDNKKRETTRIRIENFDDRGVGTLLDGYSTWSDLGKIIASGFRLKNSLKGLRNSAAFALSHVLLLRGDNVRKLDLSNLFAVQLEDESSSGVCHALVASLLRSKTNNEGRTDYSACIRHRDVSCCAIAILSLYLFARWTSDPGWFMYHEPEIFSDLSSSRNWFNIKVAYILITSCFQVILILINLSMNLLIVVLSTKCFIARVYPLKLALILPEDALAEWLN